MTNQATTGHRRMVRVPMPASNPTASVADERKTTDRPLDAAEQPERHQERSDQAEHHANGREHDERRDLLAALRYLRDHGQQGTAGGGPARRVPS